MIRDIALVLAFVWLFLLTAGVSEHIDIMRRHQALAVGNDGKTIEILERMLDTSEDHQKAIEMLVAIALDHPEEESH